MTERRSRAERPAERRTRAAGDALPEDLDVTAYVGPYLFPDTSRRRDRGGHLPRARASRALAGWLGRASNAGLLAAAVMLALIAAYHFVAGWDLKVDQTEALRRRDPRRSASRSGTRRRSSRWRGLRSRPTWRILLYSADEPPSMRGLVEVDGVDGHVLGEYTEPNPEDWSQYGLN